MASSRAVTYTDPKSVLAGARASYRFLFIPDIPLPPKSILRFDMLHRNTPLDFEIPNFSLKEEKNSIWLLLSDGKMIEAKQKKDHQGHPVFDFVLQKGVEAGEKLMIVVGSKSADHPNDYGTTAPLLAMRKRPLHLYIDPKGKGEFLNDPYLFYIDVKGADLSRIQILAPSLVSRNQRFDVIARFEDIYGNLTSKAPEQTMIEFSHDRLRENLKILLFIPESGFSIIPNLYLNETGVYRLSFRNTLTGEITYSHPIICEEKSDYQAFFGKFYASLTPSDIETAESTFRKARDVQGWNFFSISPDEQEHKTSNELWKEISSYTMEFNEEERFITFLGFTYHSHDKADGTKLIFHTKDGKALYRQKDQKTSTFLKIIKATTHKDLFAIALEPPQKLHEEFEKGVVHTPETESALLKLIESGKRFAWIGSAATGILAKHLTRESLLEAIEARRTFVTSGERILGAFNIAMEPIGSNLSLQTKPGLRFVRHIEGYVAGTDKIDIVILYRNGKEWKQFTPTHFHFTFEEYDESPIEEHLLFETGKGLFCYYHMKVIQKDGHYLITTPTFIETSNEEMEEELPVKKKKNQK